MKKSPKSTSLNEGDPLTEGQSYAIELYADLIVQESVSVQWTNCTVVAIDEENSEIIFGEFSIKAPFQYIKARKL